MPNPRTERTCPGTSVLVTGDHNVVRGPLRDFVTCPVCAKSVGIWHGRVSRHTK